MLVTSSGIEWTDRSDWNPVRGCTRVSDGCRNCYSERIAARFSGPGQPFEGFARKVGGEARWTGKVACMEGRLNLPLKWKKPARIFVNSAADLFHEAVPDAFIDRVFAVMAQCPQHTFQILSKRATRMRNYMIRNYLITNTPALQNCWLGVSVEDQETADERIPLLMETPAAVSFISAEPLLGPVHLLPGGYPDWVIAGGESGPGKRPVDLAWLRAIRDQCRAAGVPIFIKQIDKIIPIPDDLMIREFPQ